MKKLFLITGIILPLLSSAQNEIDALRYSQLSVMGSARFNGMAGSFSALGADLSLGAINPAGFGRYNKSEVGISFGANIHGTQADYNGNSAYNSDLRGNFNHVGFVGVKRFEQDNFNEWKSVQFGINYNKLATFNQSTTIAGYNTNSMLAVFAQQANGFSESDLEGALPFTSYLAYQCYAIDPLFTNNEYTHRFVGVDSINQTKQIETKGGMYETNFTLSGNYGDKFSIGMSIGLPSVRYNENTTHIEERAVASGSNNADTLERFEYGSDLVTTGRGINAKLGVIITPTNNIRIGAVIHTPSLITLTDSWQNDMYAYFADGGIEAKSSVLGRYTYRLTTPTKYIGSFGIILAKMAAINAEIEYIDYGTNKFKSARNSVFYDYSDINQTISNLYSSAINARLGGEVRFRDMFVRAGYGFSASAFDNTNEDLVKNTPHKHLYAIGLGYRNKFFFADIAFTVQKWTEDYYLYDPVLVNPADLNRTSSNISIGAGLRF